MVFGSIIPSPRGSLSLQQALDIANTYLENAWNATDPAIALVFCHDTEVSLSQVKRAAKHINDKAMRERIATAYVTLGDLLNSKHHKDEAQAFYKKSEKWGGRVLNVGQPTHPSIKGAPLPSTDNPIDTPLQNQNQAHPFQTTKQGNSIATLPRNIFPNNVRPPSIPFNPPELDSRLNNTIQLACCLGILQYYEPDDILDTTVRNWLLSIKKEQDEIDRLKTLATDVIRAFKQDEFKNAKSVTELVYLAPVLEKDDFRYLLKEFYTGIDQSGLLDVHQLEGLAHLIQGAHHDYLDTDDLVKVLALLSTRLRDTHQQSTDHIYQLTVAVSHVLDAMADANVKGLNRERLHEPLSSYLDKLKESTDPYLMYQAAYAYQALLCVPDDESLWQATLRRTGKVTKGVSGLVSAVKGLDLYGFIEGLGDIQKGLAGAGEIVQVIKDAYDGSLKLAKGGQEFFKCLQEGLSFSRKCAWYTALRGADTLIQDGQLAEFRKLVCEAPCRHDAAFQWGVCQRLGEVASNSTWDAETRRNAIGFLAEMYQNDEEWGDQANVKQWIVSILMKLSALPGIEMQFAEIQLQEMRKNGDTMKQEFYRSCRANGSGSYPLMTSQPEIASPSLLDRVQERPDVEGALRQLRRQRLKERGNAVYIPPQAKASLQASDKSRYPLMEKVNEFLEGDQKVFLLLGDSGAGKSTFNKELESQLWLTYKKNSAIPLYINLPAIDKPEHDMIAKQLRRAEFTEPQIRELKVYRKFILICDGYDESQQTHNLYTSNKLNQVGEWGAQMIISCRSEYLGVDYRDRFQPGDRNHRPEPLLFQEGVITPFSMSQVQDYITQYVSVYRPLWEGDEYKKALDLIPSLKDLVKNPFLMSLSLEVLPRLVDPGQDYSVTDITRTALYDQFIEHWLERGKKRLGEKNLSPQAKSAFESLIDEGFARNAIDYLKKLSAAIYKEQGGQPIVTYSRYKDENSWKASYFSREEEKQLLREACPLIRNGNQYRFIHRSLLEYGVALAIFDPHDWNGKASPVSSIPRPVNLTVEEASAISEQEPDLNSALAWRSFMNDPSVLQFLEERVQQEPLFKQQLLNYIEHSKIDVKWSTAAANSITILVRAGVQFNSADLRGIRVPNADLSYGMFDSAQLQGADLREVDIRGTWLRKANLSQSQMTGVWFGELPYLKHDSAVQLCVCSPDENTLAAGLSDGKIVVYSTSNWEILWTLEGHSNTLVSIVYSPDSSRIASCSESTLRIWDVLTGTCNHIINGHENWISSVAYSPQGDQIVSTAGYDMTVKLWDVETGECSHIWVGHTHFVKKAVYSPIGYQIAVGSYDTTVRVWDIDIGACLHVLRGHESAVESVAYSPRGDQVASASFDKTARLWDVVTGDCRHILTGHTGELGCSVVYSPNGNQVATRAGSLFEDFSVRLWDVNTGKCLHSLLGHNAKVTSVVYSPQGDLVASSSEDKTVRLWDADTGVCRQTLSGHSDKALSVAFLPRDQVVSSSLDTTVRLWDVAVGTSQFVPSGHTSFVRRVKSSPRGSHVATCSNDMTVRLWDVKTGALPQTLRGHSGTVDVLSFSPQGDQIATASSDNTIRLWNAETGVCTHTLTGHTSYVYDVAYSPQGNQLASAGDDSTVRLWDVESGECSYILIGHTSGIRGFIYSPDGSKVLSYSYDSTARIWDTETGACDFTLTGHGNAICEGEFSPQGNQVATSSGDATVRVWDVGTGECLQILIGHIAPIGSVTYSPRGDQIASGSEDGLMKVWDLEAKTCLWTLTGHSAWINRIVYTPLKDLVISASNDKSVRLWDVASGQCRAVIQDFQGGVIDTVWIADSGVNYLVACCDDGLVGMWEVIVDEDHCDVSLRWMTTRGGLDVKDATLQDVRGLSQLNSQLLKQRGAVGEPANRLGEAGKKVATMASVVSKLKSPTDRAKEDPALEARASVDQLEQWLEHAKDPMYMDIVAAIVKNIRGYQ